MLYGYIRDQELIVVAADSMVEFDSFPKAIEHETIRPEVVDMMMDDFFQRLRVPPFIVFGVNIDTVGVPVELKLPNRLISLHNQMISDLMDDPYAAEITEDRRKIGEIHGISEVDKWDQRSDEEKEKEKADAEKMKKVYDEAKKKGNLSGESFGPVPTTKEDTVHVTDINVTIDDDGNVKVSDVTAVKRDGGADPSDYIFATECLDEFTNGTNTTIVSILSKDDLSNYAMFQSPRALAVELANCLPTTMREISFGRFEYAMGSEHVANTELLVKGFDYSFDYQRALDRSTTDNHKVWSGRRDKQAAYSRTIDESFSEDGVIDSSGMIAIYFKMEVENKSVEEVEPLLHSKGVLFATSIRRNSPTGCWFAFLRQSDAQLAVEAVQAFGFVAEEYGSNSDGERLAPKGVAVVDTGAASAIGPRPWNALAPELALMTDEQKAANLKSYKGSEFIATVSYDGPKKGFTAYICPASWFDEHQKFYPESLGIGHLLESSFKEVSPGVYNSKSFDLNSGSFSIFNKSKMAESVLLQLHLNSGGD
jgi:hypothetical protein